MEALSYIIMVLLSLVGYSGGATGRAGKHADLKPNALDLIWVTLIWAGAIYSRLTLDYNKWMMILVWIAVSVVMGILAVTLRRLHRENQPELGGTNEVPTGFFRRIWHSWRGFSRRMGSFQSRTLLSFFFFAVVSPAAVIIKVLGDPLRIKKTKLKESYWLAKTESPAELEDYRRQF